MPKGIPPLFNPSRLSYYSFMTLLIIGIVLILGVSWLAWNRRKVEGFEGDDLDQALEIANQIKGAKTDGEIKDLMGKMVSELVSVGAFPDTSQFVRKSEMTDARCVVEKAEDRDQYIAKSAIPDQGPRIDMSQYMKKSAIPACPEIKCPEPVDLSGYVKKSSLFNQKQTACVCPQVKVSAGLCKECPPCPTMSCPACPEPEKPKCPPPAPCPEPPTQPVRYEVKYIKQPVLITKTVVVDTNNNVLSQHVKQDTESTPDMESNNDNYDSGFYDFIKNVSRNYSMFGGSTSTTKAATSTTSPSIKATMSSAPCLNETGCLNLRDLNSSFKSQNGPQGQTTM
jgi:hypothetical protein